jgi:hypothetical protein
MMQATVTVTVEEIADVCADEPCKLAELLNELPISLGLSTIVAEEIGVEKDFIGGFLVGLTPAGRACLRALAEAAQIDGGGH